MLILSFGLRKVTDKMDKAEQDLFSDIEVEDGEDYRGGEPLGIKGIALEQYRRCCIEGSKEMRKGGIERRFIKGIDTEVMIPNQREIFVNSVKMLSAVLYPELINKDQEKLVEELDTIDGDIDKRNKDYNDLLDKGKEEYKKFKHTQPFRYDKRIEMIKEDIREKKEIDLVGFFQNKLLTLSKSLKQLNYYESDKGGN